MHDAVKRSWSAPLAIAFACVGGGAHAEPLPEAIRAMIANAQRSGDPKVLAAVVAVAKQTAPEHVAEIDALTVSEAPTAPPALLTPPPPAEQTLSLAIAPPAPEVEWKGSVELGGSQSTGSDAATAAHGAVDLSRTGEAWTHRVTARAEYRDTEGSTTTERLALAYQPQISFQPGLYAYGLGQYEHDSVVGYRNRYSLGAGVGVNLADRSDFKVALDVGPALRRTEYYQDRADEAALAGRAGLNLKWLPTDRVTVGQETAVYLDGEKNTLKSLIALDTVLFGPLKGRVSYNVQREQGANDHPSVDTTTRASLLYSF